MGPQAFGDHPPAHRYGKWHRLLYKASRWDVSAGSTQELNVSWSYAQGDGIWLVAAYGGMVPLYGMLTAMANPSWYPDEVALAGRENLDRDHVARYDGKMDSNAAAELSLLEELGLGPGATVIEFGAGTGQLTVQAARACAHVVAVDVSPPMLGHLARKLSDQNLTNVTLVNAGFLSYIHSGDPVDFVYSRYALHHLPDFWKAIALNRMRALLSPGGICRLWDVVYDFAPAEATERIEAWCSQGGNSVEGEWSRDEFEEHIRDEHSTFRWLLEPMMQHAGFEILDVEYTPNTFDAKYILRAG